MEQCFSFCLQINVSLSFLMTFFTFLGKGVLPCVYALTQAKGCYSSWEGLWCIFTSLQLSKLESLHCCEWYGSGILLCVLATYLHKGSCSSWVWRDFFCVGGWILFFRLLLKLSGLIFPLLGFPTKGHSQVKLIPISECPGGPCFNHDCWVLHLWGSPWLHWQEQLMGRLMS